MHFRLTASFEAEAPEGFLRSIARDDPSDPNGDKIVALAERPLCFLLEGDRSATGFAATASIESSGHVKQYEVRQANGHLYVGIGDTWIDFREPFGRFFSSETFGGLIPAEVCVREQSEGCDRVDFGPAVRSGRIGRLVQGKVGKRGDLWQLSGHLDPQEFSDFSEAAPPSTYEPFARRGSILFTAGATDGLPHEFDFRYDFDRSDIEAHSGSSAGAFTHRQGHVNVKLSRWGETVAFFPPKRSRLFGVRSAQQIYAGLFRALYLHY